MTPLRILRSKRGSASVLVVLTLLMLLVFSVLGLVTSLSDYKLAQKNGEWQQTYYLFETEANRYLSVLDAEVVGIGEQITSVYDAWQKSGTLVGIDDPSLKSDYLKILAEGHSAEETKTRMTTVALLKRLPLEGLSVTTEKDRLRIGKTITLEAGKTYRIELIVEPYSENRLRKVIWREMPQEFDYSEEIEFNDVEVIGS